MASKSNGARVKERPSPEGRGLKEDPTIAALSTELENLLIERGSLDLNSLWNRYKQKYRKLPDLQDFRQFKVHKRSELIALCPSVKVENGYVQLTSNSGKNPKTSKKGKKEQVEANKLTVEERPRSREVIKESGKPTQEPPKVANQEKMARNYGYGPPGAGPWHMPPQYYGHPIQMQGYPLPSHAVAGQPRHSRRGPSVSKEELKNVLQDCIDRLAEAKEYVAVDKIERLVKEHFKVSHLGEVGLSRLENYNMINEHNRKLGKVNAFIQAYMLARSTCTLHELMKDLEEFCCDGADFETLKIGPLQKQPLIWTFFKFPEDKEIPTLTTTDLIEHLRGYFTKNDCWTSKQLDAADFMEYLVQELGAESGFHLGVRIRSLPLLSQVLKRAQRQAGGSIRNTCMAMNASVSNDITTAFQQLRNSLVEVEDGPCHVRQQFLTMSASEVFGEVCSKMIVLLDSLKYIHEQCDSFSGLIKRDYDKSVDVLKKFQKQIRTEKLFCLVFQFAVCTSREEMHRQLQELLENTAMEIKPPDQSKAEEGGAPPPPLEKLVEMVVTYMDRFLFHGPLSLSNLSQIENRMLEDFNNKHFTALGQGAFLKFILTNETVKKKLDESGGSTLGSTGGGTARSVYQPSQQDILHFISQTAHSNVQIEQLEKALCHHYNSKDVKDLGKVTISHLKNILEKAPVKHHSVIYEGALCVKSSSTWTGKSRQVGILGHKVKHQALACLQNCPLLEDLADWSHWDLVFQPELGELKDFVQKYGGIHTVNVSGSDGPAVMTTNLMALETKPGTLLKVTCDTSADKFLSAAQQGNVTDTCGHLVSLVITNKGVDGTPLALLGNHIKTALFTMQSSSSDVPGAPGCAENTKAVRFILECLLKIPVMLCQATATQVFLEPLSHVVGATKSKEMLQKLCKSSSEESRLQLLGCLLGIQDWAASFEERCVPPSQCLESLNSAMQDVFEDTIEVDSDEEEVKDEPEVFTLSDDSSDEEEETKQKMVVQVKQEPVPMEEDTAVVELSTTEDESDVISDSEVEVLPDLSKEEQKCWQIVEKIRREEFGVNVQLSEDGQKLMVKQQERLGRSLDRLSKDLYSKDTHFVLELIQNADDNDYSPEQLSSGGSECPAVEFLVDRDCVSVMNNELGFEEKNVRAICDVGKSTKGKHKYGYIGQKGIGFKSVFRVTDSPMIHSNGYHIKFDVTSGPMGYILPHWTSDENISTSMKRWKTSIILPLKSEFQTSSSSQSMAARFQDIHPSLLLFLHRLKSITINNKVDNYVMKMQRKDLGNHMTEIKHSSGTDRWLVVRKTLDASAISLQAKSGVEVESSEIAMAFPIIKEMKDKRSHVNLQKQPVFAFLPLRSYGFRFVIQGDFDVPSSREDVDKDSLWNQWLRTELHTLFADVMDIFRTHPDLNGLAGLAYFMNFIPLEDEILDFFRPVASNILQHLRSKPCLPAQPNGNGAVEWKLPSQLVFCTDRLLREVMTSADLHQHLGLSYLHEEMMMALNPSLVENLGIQKLKCHHLMEVAKGITLSLHDDDMIDLTDTIMRVAKLLAGVYRLSDDLHSEDELRQHICQLPIMPLSTGEFVSLSTTSVFFPVAMETSGSKGSRRSGQGHGFVALQKDLRTLHPHLISSLDEVANLQVIKFLEKLGAKQFTPADVVHYHIIPTFKGDAWKNKSQELLVDYLLYVKDALETQPSLLNMDDLKSIVVLKTNKGLLRPSEQPIHFSSAYALPVDLQKSFSRCDWTVIDDCYLGRTQRNANGTRNWVAFLTKLGVYPSLAVESKTVVMKPDDWDSSPWASYKELLSDSTATYQIKDFVCDEFKHIVDTEGSNLEPAVKHQRMSCLFKMLDESWESYQCYTMAALEDSRGNKVRELQSSFGMHVETFPWVPASQEHVVAQETGNCSTFRETFLSRGSELFMPILNIKSLLTHHVAYFCCPTRSPSLLLQYLKVRQSVDVEFVKEKFKEWGKQQESEDKSKYLCTSLTHIKMIYRYLQDNLPPKQLQDLLMDMPFVFLPKPKLDLASMQDLIVAGRLLRRKDVRWRDPTGLFQKYTESLESANLPSANKTSIHHLYSSLLEFFLRSGRVEEEPEIEDYVSLLKHLSSSFPVSKVLSDVHQIFSTLGSMLRTAITDPDQNIAVVKLNSAKTKLKLEAVIPVRNNKWVKLSEEPMIADDRQLERMFAGRGEKGVYFVETSRRFVKNQMGPRLPKPQSAKEMAEQEETMIEFLESFGVKKLSNCINIMYSPEMFFPCPEIQQYVRDVVPYIQRDLLTEFPNTYEQLKAKGMSESLSKAAFGRVDKLEVVYSLKHLPNEVAKTSANCRFTDNYEFYVLKAHVENYSEINGELARFFSCGDNNVRDEIRSLLIEILPLMQSHRSSDLEDLLERNDITSLPESEAPWTVPEPVFAIPEPEQDDGYMDVDEGDADELLVKFKPKRSDAGGGVPSWPPKSSQMDPKVLAGQPSTCPAPIWPPPATPAHSQTRSGDLSHLRPAREDLVKMRQDAEKEGGKEAGAEMERSPSVASNDTSYSGLSHRSGPPGPGSQFARPHGPPHGPPRSPSGDYHPSPHPHPTQHQYSGEPRPPGTSNDRPLGEHSSPHPHGYSGHVRPEGDSYEGQTGSANPSPVHTPGGKVDPGRKRPRVESDSSLDLNRSQLDQSALNQSNLWFDPPIWRGEGEIPYEEVGKEKGLKFEALADLPENSENEIVGRWGETIVYEYLQSHFEKDPSVVKIRWMNEQRETGLPYDLEVHFYDEEKQITNLVYVEVKATLKDKKAGFLISANEVKFAMDLKDNYHLYRVFNAGNTESVRLTKLENLALHLSEGAIKLFMVV